METLYKYICMRTNFGILRINMKIVQMKIAINPKNNIFTQPHITAPN